MKNCYIIQFIALFAVVLLGETAWGQQYPSSSDTQTLCFGTSQPYCVDCTENAGAGTPGSTYTWSIINGPGVPTFTGQGTNRITIDWSTVVAGTYTLQVLETTTNPVSCNGVLSSMTVVINPLLQATVTPVTPICSGSNAVFNFTGPNNGTVTFTVNGGAAQTVSLNAAGSGSYTMPNATANQTVTLVSVTDGICTNPVTGNATVVINNLLAATITPVTPICSAAAAVFNVTGPANGSVVIAIAGTNYTINLDNSGAGSYSVAGATSAVTASLVSVSNGTCSNPVTGNATVDISPLLTASVSATSPVCYNGTATFNFTGTPNATVTFTVNGSTQTVTLNGLGTGNYSVSSATTNQSVVLVSATNGTCTNPVSGNSNIVVSPLLQASVSSLSPICYNGNAVFSFTGTPNTTVTYTLNGSTLTVALDGSGVGSYTVSNATATQTIALVSITDGTCTNTISGGSSVVVNPLLQATVTPITPICSGSDAVFNFTGPANGTITYSLNGGANATITLTPAGTYTLTVPAVSSNQTVTLVSAADATCSNPVTGTATVVINTLLTATVSPNSPICYQSAAVFTFTGPASGTITFAINGGASQTVTLDASGAGSYTVAGAATNQIASLISVSNGSCSNPISGSSTVAVNPQITTTPIFHN
jgi:hypothetical protein